MRQRVSLPALSGPMIAMHELSTLCSSSTIPISGSPRIRIAMIGSEGAKSLNCYLMKIK